MSIDLTTKIGHLELSSPIIVGSCPLTTDEMPRVSMISNGVGAMVMPSIHVDLGASPDAYLKKIEAVAKQSTIPVIASLRVGLFNEKCGELTAQLEQTGASAIEISFVIPTEINFGSQEFDDGLASLVSQIDAKIGVPLLVKLRQGLPNVGRLAEQIHRHVDGLIMFGRSPIVDIELDSLSLTRKWGITESGSVVSTLEPMMRTNLSYPDMPLIACGGIGTSEDLIKAILAGASACMVTSAIYRNGIATLGNMKEGLLKFMNDRGLNNLAELHAIRPSIADTDDAEKLFDYSRNSRQNISQLHSTRCDRFGHPVS